MKKIKKAVEELAFIKDATPEELLNYVLEYPFRPRSEKPFIQRGLTDPILIYIEQYGLHPSAVIALFQLGNIVLIRCLLAQCNQTKETIISFLNYAPYTIVKSFTDDFSYPELPEQEALARFDEKELSQLIAKKKLSLFAKCDILARGSETLALQVIQMGGLQKREMDMVVNNCSKACFEALICTQTNPTIKQNLHELYLLRFQYFHKLKRVIKKTRLHKEAEKIFLNCAPVELLMHYVSRYQPEGGESILLHYPDRRKLVFYLSKNWLSEEGENLLMKIGRHEEIKAYIKMHTLLPHNEVRLIKRKKHREIMLYLSKHTFSLEAGIELVLRGNKEEIKFMATNQPLAEAVIAAIKDLSFAEEILATAYYY